MGPDSRSDTEASKVKFKRILRHTSRTFWSQYDDKERPMTTELIAYTHFHSHLFHHTYYSLVLLIKYNISHFWRPCINVMSAIKCNKKKERKKRHGYPLLTPTWGLWRAVGWRGVPDWRWAGRGVGCGGRGSPRSRTGQHLIPPAVSAAGNQPLWRQHQGLLWSQNTVIIMRGYPLEIGHYEGIPINHRSLWGDTD